MMMMMMMMMMMLVIGGRLDAVYDRRTEEILQCDEKTRLQETTKTDTKAQGKYTTSSCCAANATFSDLCICFSTNL